MPRLPRETKVDVTKCHACHAQCRGVTPKPDPSAPPSAMSATPATRNDRGCEIVPRLPRKTKVDASLCYACHVKRRWMSSLCHACHVKRRWMSPSATPATHNAAASHTTRAPKPDPSAPPSAMSATPATQNDGGCEIVPRLPRETKVDVTRARLNQTQARHPVP